MSINLEIVLNTRYLCLVVPLAAYIKLYIFKISLLNDFKVFIPEIDIYRVTTRLTHRKHPAKNEH